MKPNARVTLLEMGMFDGPWTFLGESLRPITLGSLHACHCMGLPLHAGVPAFDALEEEQKPLMIARFLWAHQASPETVKLNVLSGDFPAAAFTGAPTVVALFRLALQRWHELVEAASVEAIPRASWQDDDEESPPRGQVDPSYLADFIWLLTKGEPTPEKIHWVLWELPFVQALQFYHCRLRESRFWTIPKGAPAANQGETLSKVSQMLEGPAAEEDGLL